MGAASYPSRKRGIVQGLARGKSWRKSFASLDLAQGGGSTEKLLGSLPIDSTQEQIANVVYIFFIKGANLHLMPGPGTSLH